MSEFVLRDDPETLTPAWEIAWSTFKRRLLLESANINPKIVEELFIIEGDDAGIVLPTAWPSADVLSRYRCFVCEPLRGPPRPSG